jgi:hypothetical protein
MNRVLYKPFGMVVSVLGGLAAGTIFKRLWRLLSHGQEAPSATQPGTGWSRVLVAAMVEGAVFGVVKAAIDRGGAVAFSKLTGRWPTE